MVAASMVISVAARALLTGQDALAASAVLTNVASSTPSELPRTVRWIEGMRKPPAGSGADRSIGHHEAGSGTRAGDRV